MIDFSEGEVVATGARMTYEGDTQERLGVERSNDEDRPVVVLTRPVQLIAHVDADRTPPNLTGMIEGALPLRVKIPLVSVPPVEVLLHMGAVSVA